MKVVVRGDDDEVETVRIEAAVGSGGCVGGGCGNDVDGGMREAMAVVWCQLEVVADGLKMMVMVWRCGGQNLAGCGRRRQKRKRRRSVC
ncbi:hypothetical protein Tco_0211964 [Tanacetum coccineum]